jgi:hypothetical protein
MMNDKDEDLPLHAEAKAREKWRGGETLIKKGAEDTSLPASEVDNAAMGAGSSDEPQDGRPGKGGPGTIPPPD